MYVSAGAVPNSRCEGSPDDLYAKPVKDKRSKSANGAGDIYAVVNKPKKKGIVKLNKSYLTFKNFHLYETM
mgnify:CR=1 FL=1